MSYFYLFLEKIRRFFAFGASELRLERFCGCVENTLAKRGIAVKRERARQIASRVNKNRTGIYSCPIFIYNKIKDKDV